MKLSPSIISFGSLSLICLIFYAAFNSNRMHANNDQTVLSIENNNDQFLQGNMSALTLKDQIADLRREVLNIRKAVGNINEVQKELDVLTKEMIHIRQQLLAGGSHNKMNSAINAGFDKYTDQSSFIQEQKITEVEQQKIKDQDRKMLTERVFGEEYIDKQWSLDTTNKISEDFMDMQLAQTDLSNVECHSSLCRVEVIHHDNEAVNEFIFKFPMKVNKAFPQINYHYQHQEDGSITMIAFLAQESYEFPVLDE